MIFFSNVAVLNYDAEDYHLANDEWKSDIIPEIMDGKNIADFVDPDIAEKLEALEREEEMLEAEGFYEDHEDMVSSHVQGSCVTLQMDLLNTFVGRSTRMTSVKQPRQRLRLATRWRRRGKRRSRTRRAFRALRASARSLT
jgi:hypothetical protein